MIQHWSPENQWIVIGPPGTGKTSWIQKEAQRAVQKFGPDKVLLASFSRAAARELASRDIDINDNMVGTLHSLAFHALGRPVITETLIKEWNEFCVENNCEKEFSMSAKVVTKSDDFDTDSDSHEQHLGDQCYEYIMLLRARQDHAMLEHLSDDDQRKRFYLLWQQFKRETNSMDFTDLIEIALQDVDYAPNRPVVGFFDESQDLSRLEFALISKWGQHMNFFFIVGDPDQSIYEFKGASPTIFTSPPTPPARTRVLRYSYRVPRAVHAVAVQWIRGVANRLPAEYYPRDTDGFVRYEPMLYFGDHKWTECLRRAEVLVDDVMCHYLPHNKTVMLLGSCAYHIDAIKIKLREAGIPFHNPYRRIRTDWNPLRATRGTPITERVQAIIAGAQRGTWSVRELKLWVPLVQVQGTLQRGAKTAIERLPDSNRLATRDELQQWFDADMLSQLLSGNVLAIVPYLAKTCGTTAQYVFNIYRRYGLAGLTQPPQVIIGTIHSVKGGEADVVYLDTTLSPQAFLQWLAWDRDAIIRTYYVGLTRAREGVVVCGGRTRMNITHDLAQCLPTAPYTVEL